MAKNQVSMSVTDVQLRAVMDAFDAIHNNLPGLIALTREDRRSLASMGDKTVEFVNKAAGYANRNQSFVPGFVSIDELNKDVDTVNKLKDVRRRWNHLGESLDDTIMLAGSEAYASSLSIYKTIKDAAGNNVEGAKIAEADLSKRFPQHRRRKAAIVAEPEKVDSRELEAS